MEALNKKASAVASKMSRQRGAQFRDGRFDILHAQRKAAMPRRFRSLMLSISSSAQCWARLRRQLFYAAILPPARSTMAATMPFAPSGPAASNAAATEMTAADAAKLQQALAAYDQGRSQEAPPLLEELLTCHPANFNINETLGLIHAESGDFSAKISAPPISGSISPARRSQNSRPPPTPSRPSCISLRKNGTTPRPAHRCSKPSLPNQNSPTPIISSACSTRACSTRRRPTGRTAPRRSKSHRPQARFSGGPLPAGATTHTSAAATMPPKKSGSSSDTLRNRRTASTRG
jgi:hypothetical protein